MITGHRLVDNVNATHASRSAARMRTLHLAEGILTGLLSTTPEHSLNELLGVARRSGISPNAIAHTLVAIAAGQSPLTADDPATVAVRTHWGAELSRIPARIPELPTV
jgi:hypothetical protein